MTQQDIKLLAKLIVTGLATAQGVAAVTLTAALNAIDAASPLPAAPAPAQVVVESVLSYADGGVITVTITAAGARQATLTKPSPLAQAALAAENAG